MWKHTLVFICLLLQLCAQAQAENAQIIRFADIQKYAGQVSPRAREIEGQYQLTDSERRMAREWSNPRFAFESQKVAGVREAEYLLSKSFVSPWSYLSGKKAWDLRMRAAHYRRIASLRELEAQLKAGYVSLGLYQEQSERLEQVRAFVLRASEIARQRHQEGFISGTENHLIQMALLNLSTGRQSVLEEQRNFSAEWRTSMGLPIEGDVRLADQPRFQRFDLKSLLAAIDALGDQPALLALSLSAEGMGKLASTEGQRILPEFELAAGIKHVGSEGGSIIGVSVTLPLLNRNRAVVHSLRAQEQIAQSEAAIALSRTKLRLESLLQSLADLESMLEPVAGNFAGDAMILSDLLLAYEEGFVSLSELLNSIQIEFAGSMSYYEQLRKYYAGLFELEALTGYEIVRLGDQEIRP